MYAITGTGHHSKNGKDKVQRAIRSFLDEWRYVYREFSAQGDRGGMGGILGIDPKSFDRRLLAGGTGNGAHVPSSMNMTAMGDALSDSPINADGQIPRGETELVVKVKEGKKKVPVILQPAIDVDFKDIEKIADKD